MDLVWIISSVGNDALLRPVLRGTARGAPAGVPVGHEVRFVGWQAADAVYSVVVMVSPMTNAGLLALAELGRKSASGLHQNNTC